MFAEFHSCGMIPVLYHCNNHVSCIVNVFIISSLGISISKILCYSTYFRLTKTNYPCFSLAFGISFHDQFCWMDLGS